MTVYQLTDEVNSWLASIGDLKVDRQMVYEALGQMDGDGCAGSTYSYGIRTWFLYAEH